MLGVALEVGPFLLQELLQFGDLSVQLLLHLLKLSTHLGFEVPQPLFVIFNQGVFLVFKQLIHLRPLVLVILLHHGDFALVVLSHDPNFFLQLVHEVAGLPLEQL